MSFNERLRKIIEQACSYVCVGLDTDPARIPSAVKGSPCERVIKFNRAIIDATHSCVSAYKLNSAFYEAQGPDGIRAMKDTFDYLPDHVVSIADVKRGDIGTTAAQYAAAVFEYLGADAATVSPYLGSDSVEPFISYTERGSFVLCLTSNASADEFQKLKTAEGTPFFISVAEKALSWNSGGNIGLVVGATRPEEFNAIRVVAPDIPLLVPGIGAQGGDLEKVVVSGIGVKRSPVLINSSRGIIYRSSSEDFAEAACAECQRLNDQISSILGMLGPKVGE
ncbi:orotidine-5'-phosphate decarboxylase [candidate division KSB1 bacterium]